MRAAFVTTPVSRRGVVKMSEYIASDSCTVHRGNRDDGAECGQHAPNGWATVDADSDEEAVMHYNLQPCTKCIDKSYTLRLWRKDVYSATVVNGVDAPERWQND